MTRDLNRQLLRIALAGIVLVACYARVMISLADQWATNPLFSYGFAVPLISACLVWARLPDLRQVTQAPDYWLGVPLTLTAAGMLLVGQVGAIVMLQGISLIVALAGLTLLLFGRRVLQQVWFPIVYLFLMLPVWDYPINRLQAPSQDLSARIAVYLLHAAGIPALQNDMLITLPTRTLHVMRECSGVAQLIALIAMVLPAAYLWLGTLPRRIALLVIALVVGYLSNGLRIALIGFLAEKGLSDGDSSSPFHMLQGLAVSALGYLVIGGCISLLSKRTDSVRSEAPGAGDAFAAPTMRPWLEVAAVVMLLLAATSQLWAQRTDVRLGGQLSSLPGQISDWSTDPLSYGATAPFQGLDDELVGAYPSPTGKQRFAAVDDELVRAYRSASGGQVQVYIGYYRRQQQGKELTGGVGQALQAVASDVTIQLKDETLRLNEVVQDKAGAQRGVVFWYDVNGRIVSNVYAAKGYTIWDAIMRRRTNAAVIMIVWDGRNAVESERARQDAIGFAQALVPVLRQHLPS